MHPDKWPEIKERILNNFANARQSQAENPERREILEILEFDGPMGEMKLAWITRPKVLETKTHYSNRIGGDVSVDVVYSDDEVTHTLKIYRWHDGLNDWQEIEADNFNF